MIAELICAAACFGVGLMVGRLWEIQKRIKEIDELLYDTIETYDNYLKNRLSGRCTAQKVYQIKKDSVYCLKDIFLDENLDLIWERKEAKCMTAEEMKEKLEELTGEKIEIIPSRREMIEELECYCEDLCDCDDCVIANECDHYGAFDCWKNEHLRECYEKVMEDGRKV